MSDKNFIVLNDPGKPKMTHQLIIAGNWKMNVLNSDGITLAKGLADKFKTSVNLPFEMLVCPPYTLINSVTDLLFDTHIQVGCLLYTSPSPRDRTRSRMPSSA